MRFQAGLKVTNKVFERYTSGGGVHPQIPIYPVLELAKGLESQETPLTRQPGPRPVLLIHNARAHSTSAARFGNGKVPLITSLTWARLGQSYSSPAWGS